MKKSQYKPKDSFLAKECPCEDCQTPTGLYPPSYKFMSPKWAESELLTKKNKDKSRLKFKGE